MKKLILALCAVSVFLTGAAFAEQAELPVKTLLPIDPAGVSIDLDGDGKVDEISLVETVTDTSETYALTVNGATLEGDGWGLNGNLYAMRLGETDRAYLLVSENGPSDDPQNYVYRYKEGTLVYCGAFGSWADSVTITDEGFTATVRANVIQTWFRRADFIITDNSYFDDQTGGYVTADPVVVEVPRDIYAMGTVVTLKKDIPLQVSRTDDAVALTIKAGEKAVIVATDDRQWLYIETLTQNTDAQYNAGWIRLADAFDVEIGGEAITSPDVFNGLMFAD